MLVLRLLFLPLALSEEPAAQRVRFFLLPPAGTRYLVRMRFINVDHIGIAVADLDESIATYTRLLGCGPSRCETVPTEKVRVAFFDAGPTRIELLAATDATSPIAKFIAKRGPGIHHICFAVADMDVAIAGCRADGLTPLSHGDRIGAEGKRVAFFHPKETGGVLIELVEATS